MDFSEVRHKERKKQGKDFFYLLIKRINDIQLAIIAIIILFPVFIVVGLMIKIENPKASVFFKQERAGKDGRLFHMYKFRSMQPDAEKKVKELTHLNEIEGKMFKIKKDPRVTAIGKFIRAYSIDELPQLYNVIKGDMSLIGPRPPLVSEFITYSEREKNRLCVRPGMSGLWQVSGRNSLTFEEMIELDFQYINNVSLFNDMKIILKTFSVVIKKDNAY